IITPSIIVAVDDSPITKQLCNIVEIFTSQIGIIFAVVAIAFVGIQLFRGRMDWITGATIVIAVLLITKAPDFVNLITGDNEGFDKICPSQNT
ncbi:MAG TPA: TrbC/VirB2 family protein, partial [Candidatus Megaira endosymbiont of Hartmannula sinica]|nr:TrbC/VirB2 family protein [Candidatus Megaera endosymbiont of Hartmannula sinica]